MKVLQIINSLAMGGAEKLVTESVPLFHQKGIDMDVILLKKTNSPLEKNFKYDVTLQGGKSVYNPLHIFKIIPLLKRYDVIHIHLFPALYWVVLAKYLSFSKVKLIYTEHSTNNKRRNNRVFRLFDRLIYRGLGQIVTISDEVLEQLKIHLGHNVNTISLVYNGINFEKFASAEPYSKEDFFSAESCILIQVSSFRYPKDQKTLIKTIGILPEKYKLVLVGDGPNKEELMAYVKEIDIEDRIKFLGIRTDVERLLKMADFIILSSAYEGMSLSSIEGMSVGKPFIATNVPGLTSIVEGYGVLFNLGDEIHLAKIVEELDNDKDQFHRIAMNCLERAKMFSLEKTVDDYIKEYQRLMNKH